MKKQKLNYATEEELEYPSSIFDLQITNGLETCKTKNDVIGLLADVRAHEKRRLIEKFYTEYNKPENQLLPINTRQQVEELFGKILVEVNKS